MPLDENRCCFLKQLSVKIEANFKDENCLVVDRHGPSACKKMHELREALNRPLPKCAPTYLREIGRKSTSILIAMRERIAIGESPPLRNRRERGGNHQQFYQDRQHTVGFQVLIYRVRARSLKGYQLCSARQSPKRIGAAGGNLRGRFSQHADSRRAGPGADAAGLQSTQTR